MQKLFVLGFALCALFSCTQDEEVNVATSELEESNHLLSQEQAVQNAMDFLQQFTPTTRSNKAFEVESVESCHASESSISTRATDNDNDIAFYAVNLKDNAGFVIASADNRYEPVLAYIENGTYSNEYKENSGFNMIVQNLVERRKNHEDTIYFKSNTHETRSANSYVTPLLTTKWGMDSPYNKYAVSGRCNPMGVALAQICSYYRYPTSFSLHHTYPDTTIVYTMNWTSIMAECDNNSGQLLEENTNSDQVARLIQAIALNYPEETIYYSEICLSRMANSGYEVSWLYPLDDSSDDAAVRSALNQNKLIYARGFANKNTKYYNGHAWVIDGYTDDYFHCNWGLHGYHNGYYLRTLFNPYVTQNYQYQRAYATVYRL